MERLVARADLLDSINVFPIADGDTGRNLSLVFSLCAVSVSLTKKLFISFFCRRAAIPAISPRSFFPLFAQRKIFLNFRTAKEGAKKAWRAVSNPRPGTMLSVFDALADILPQAINPDKETVDSIIGSLEKSVHETYEQLPRLNEAGVVDAGALGMYIFFQGFFYTLAGIPDDCRPVTETFKNRLQISSSFQETAESGYCVDFVVKHPVIRRKK